MGDQTSHSSFQRDIGIPINFKNSQALALFEALNTVGLSRCQGMWGPLSK